MRVFQGRVFEGFDDRPSLLPWRREARVFEHLEFRRCAFRGCLVSITKDPRLRATIRDVTVSECEQSGCELGPAIVGDVLVEKSNLGGSFWARGAVFRHVTLRGYCGGFVVDRMVDPSSDDPRPQRMFDEANARYAVLCGGGLGARHQRGGVLGRGRHPRRARPPDPP